MTESDAGARQMATVAQLAQRVAELEREVAERRQGESLQHALYEIASLSAADSPEHEHYARLHEIVGRLMYAKNFIIATYDAEEGMIHQEYLVDEDPRPAQGELSLRRGHVLTGDPQQTSVADGSTTCSRRWSTKARSCGVHAAPIDFNSWMGAPLIAQDKVYGLIIVQSYSADINYTQADLDLLSFVASHVAATAARWKANASLKRAMDDLAASAETLRLVGNIGKDLTGSLDTEAICRSLEKRFSALLPVDVFGVAMLSPAGDALDYVFYVEDGLIDEPSSFPLDHPTSLAALTFREDRELTLFNEAQLANAPSASVRHQSTPIMSAVFCR